jgi:hypothetical protein
MLRNVAKTVKIVAALSGALLVTTHPMKTTAEEVVGDIQYKTVVEDFLICDFAKHSYSAPLGESMTSLNLPSHDCS